MTALRLEPRIEGRSDGPTLFFIQGWPDDLSVWDDQVAFFGERYRCVRVDLPNMAGERGARWGFSNRQIVEALARCIREVSPADQVTLVIHDWGAHWGYCLHKRWPELVDRVAGLDVAPHFAPDRSNLLPIVSYQWWLLAALILGGPIGNWMTRSFARKVKSPRQGKDLDSWMNYPYLHIWRDIASGRAREDIRGYWPHVPVLFVFGARKAFYFHTERWLDHVRARAGGQIVALENTGHWVMNDPGFNEILEDWLESTCLE